MRYVLSFAVFVLAAAALSAPAQAAPCWEDVIEDWFENERVDRTYPIHCYREALRNLPEDMRAYSSAPEDIARAMREAIARKNKPGTTTEGAGGPAAGGGSGGSGGKSAGGSAGGEMPAPAVESPGSAPQAGLFREALDEIGPSGASSFPLPLAVLGGVALLLMAGGGAGLIARRMRPARPPLTRR